MTEADRATETARDRLSRPLTLTRLGMLCERLARAFWPVYAVIAGIAAALLFGAHDAVPLEVSWGAVLLVLGALVWALVRGLRRFRWPRAAEARERLDRTLAGRPLAALADHQATGTTDTAATALWRAHLARMAERARAARAVPPDMRLAERDPCALRYVALTALVLALLFGSLWRVGTVTEIAPGAGSPALAAGPSWEGWIEPPGYTDRPTLYLNDIRQSSLSVPEGSRVTLRLYGEVGALSVSESVSGREDAPGPEADATARSFEVAREGEIAVDGTGGQAWRVALTPDSPPEIAFRGEVARTAQGEMRQDFTASDDYGVVAGRMRVTLDRDALDRRYGLAAEPEPREPLTVSLPMPVAGDRDDVEETLTADLSKHPWAGLPVEVTLVAEDAAGQTGRSETVAMTLPGRRFFQPLSSAIAEQRRDLLWTRENGERVARVLRAVTNRPGDVFPNSATYLRFRQALRDLEGGLAEGLSGERRDAVAKALWELAVELEQGNLSDAEARLHRAQEQLAEAMRNGANQEEIDKLMRELQQAMQEYMRELARQSEQQGENQARRENSREITQGQMQQMLDRMQEMMEQGRMAEAQRMLEQLRRMMENMQVTRGEGQQGPGQQAMEGLSETLRRQQELSDDSFSGMQGQRGQQGRRGQQGQQGQGQFGQRGQGRQGQGQGAQPGQGGPPTAEGLAERQRQLRDELQRQRRNLPGLGGEQGEAAGEALGRAEDAMNGAEQALRNRDLAEALDEQSRAMEALREGMRNLGEALAQQQQPGQPGQQQGRRTGRADPGAQRDPLGRRQGRNGSLGTEDQLLQGENGRERAQEILDEIRRRSGERERPEEELDYLRRLLERF